MESGIPRGPGGSVAASMSIKIYRIRALVKRYWWILFLTIAAGVGIEAWIVLSKPDMYSSSSDVIVREQLQNDMSKQYSDYFGSLIGNTLKMLQSPEMHEEAKRRIELEAPQLTGSASISASVAPRTSIFTVEGTGSNPEYTQRFVDAVIAEFMVQYRGMRVDTAAESRTEMNLNREKIRQQLAEAVSKRNEFKKANNMDFWVQQKDEANNHLAELRNRLTALNAERNRLDKLTPDQLLSTAPAPPMVAQATTDRTAEDPVFSPDMVNQYLQTTRELNQQQAVVEERSKVWKPKHPRMMDLVTLVERSRRDLESIRSQAVTLARARLAAIEVWVKTTQEDIEVWTTKAKEANEKSSAFSVLEDVVTDLRVRETKLNEAIGNLDIKTDTNLLKVLRKASIPSLVNKHTARHITLGVLGGLAAGALILFLLNRADDRMASSSELLEHFVEPILGQIPDVSESRTEQGLPLIYPDDERFTYAEAFRSLRSSLIFMPNQSDMKLLLVTSAIPNEGKSTIVSNLAVTMANSGARVLVVDADLRRGDLTQIFDVEPKHGLSNILRGEVPWRNAIVESKVENLSLIARGPVTNQSGELLLKPELEGILAEMKSAYDLVIFNTAPILATDDTPTVAPQFDGVLMVVRAQFTSARLTQNALNTLYQRQVNVLGLILNCIDVETPDYHYYRYPKYYAA